ncbi:hypothetical protein FB451DRAFT_1413278 [Mycena latifolia]|nr:hypothetical protein FB451DRAFT_1413278 [Mycena latifolia]
MSSTSLILALEAEIMPNYSSPILVPFDHRLLSRSTNKPLLCPYRASTPPSHTAVTFPATLPGSIDIPH